MDSAEDNAWFRRGAPREARQPIRFAGLVHDEQGHVCAFFHNPDEGVSGATFVSGGSIEMHFHFFMIMALLVIYSDWRLGWIVLVLTTLHHVILNYLQPQWVYFYGRNDFSVVAHLIPVTGSAIFTTLLCQNNRRSV